MHSVRGSIGAQEDLPVAVVIDAGHVRLHDLGLPVHAVVLFVPILQPGREILRENKLKRSNHVMKPVVEIRVVGGSAASEPAVGQSAVEQIAGQTAVPESVRQVRPPGCGKAVKRRESDLALCQVEINAARPGVDQAAIRALPVVVRTAVDAGTRTGAQCPVLYFSRAYSPNNENAGRGL